MAIPIKSVTKIVTVCLFLFSFANNVRGQLCDDKYSVELKDAKAFVNKTIVNDGVAFPPEFRFQKDINGINKTFGCLCKYEKCLRKCCPVGFAMSVAKRACDRADKEDILWNEGLDVYFLRTFQRKINIKSREYDTIYGIPCVARYREEKKWFVQKDGKLYIEVPNAIPPWLVQDIDKYCIDTFIYENEDGSVSTKLDALVCFPEKQEEHYYILSSTCMLISCVFILATLGVYMWLPELRNLHGRVLMAYLICLLIAFSQLAAMQIMLQTGVITMSFCTALSICIYFFLLSAFFWLNIMCFDIWWTFSGKRGVTLKNLTTTGRFYAYTTYAFGIPAMLTLLLVGLEFSGLPEHPLLPMLRDQGCFFAGRSRLLYLYGPILLISISNMVFFVLTATKIAMIKRQTSVLKSQESATHDQQSKDKQRFLLYVKLFIVMGINWILEVISALYPNSALFWRAIDAYNVLTGVLIFTIFICKKKIFHLIKKRIHVKLRKTDSRDDVGPLPHDQQRLQNIKNSRQRASLDTIRTAIDTSNCVVNQCRELRPTLVELITAATKYD